MTTYERFTFKKQTRLGPNQGKWCVYRPDGIRLVVCPDRKTAVAIAYGINVARTALKGDWQQILR